MRPTLIHYKEILEITLSFSGVCWWIIDLKDDPGTYYCNDFMQKVFSLDAYSKGHSVKDTCPIAGDYIKNVEKENEEDAATIFHDYNRLLSREISEYANEFPYFEESTGMVRHFLSRAKPLTYDDSGQIELLFGIVEDVTAQQEQRKLLENERAKFKTLSEIDGLTGLYNRRYFEGLFQSEIIKAIRENTTLGISVVDIDYFKQFNDSYGHVAGDECLVKVANAIRQALTGSNDTASRVGGEEFVIVSPGASVESLNLLACNLHKSVASLCIPHLQSDADEHVTISIGAAAGRIHSRTQPPQHLERADQCLYQAKRNGRNRYVVVDLDAPRGNLKIVA